MLKLKLHHRASTEEPMPAAPTLPGSLPVPERPRVQYRGWEKAWPEVEPQALPMMLYGASSTLSAILLAPPPRDYIQANQASLVLVESCKVFDSQGRDVTPLPLVAVADDPESKTHEKPSLEEVLFKTGSFIFKSSTPSDMVSSSFRLLGSSFTSLPVESGFLSRSSITDYSFPLHGADAAAAYGEFPLKPGRPGEPVAQAFDIILSETDTFSLLDLSPTLISEDAEDADAMNQRNRVYAEFCSSKMGSDNYLERSSQALVGESKCKYTQTKKNSSVNKGTIATIWDIYDSFSMPNDYREIRETEQVDYLMSTRKEQDSSEGTMSGDSGSDVSSEAELDADLFMVKTEPDLEKILLSEAFMNSALVMERVIVLNVFQPQLAAFRGLPVLKDPDIEVRPGSEEHITEKKDKYLTPTLEPLWTFVSPLTRGHSITSMAWNKKNPDILAVGYGGWSSGNPQPGLICCWSLKNLMWSERVFPCHNSVTCLEFSSSNPSHLAVGMYDGSVAIYNVQVGDHTACIADSRDCAKRHMQPVWQVTWTKQQLQLSGEEREEVLVSVTGDGRITKWLILHNGFNCVDLMILKRSQGRKQSIGGGQSKTENVLLPQTTVLCIDFHPDDTGIYVIGTWDGGLHKCSLSNSDHFLDTYCKHPSPVTHIEWSPLYSDVFLSSSSDGTIQLWKLDTLNPKMSFTSVQSIVDSVKWSPNSCTVFAAIYRQHVEVWDLSRSIMLPTMVHHAEPGVTLSSLLFAKGSDSVLVGDSQGEVTVYKLKNFRVGKGKKVLNLDDVMASVAGYVD
ncbi:WD repeat-containing protein 78-like [Xiphophorus hellerii]|uniref:WD repeat-containing protein 78-like n=1 Tax=Xiphophorus hellerii TaxID=8084 RepID=UPI0013B360DF|nr:WD repeat-containing protein 78-like [Xiphophorus hellerii]